MPEQKGKHFSRSQGRIQRLGLNLNGIEREVKGLVMTEERNTSRDSVGRLKTQKHTALFNTTIPASETLSASTAASGILNIQSSMTNQSTAVTANTTATSKTSKKTALIHPSTAPAAEGLNPSSQTGSAVGPTASKLRSPNMRHNLKPQADANISAKTSPKNIQKTTSASHVLGSVDSPKTLQKTASTSQISSTDPPKSLNRNSLSHIPRPASSPKLKPQHTAASVKVDKTERNKRQLSTSQKDRMIDRPSESKLEPGTNTALVKSPQRQQEQEMKSRKQREGEKLGDEGGKAGGTSALQGTQVEKSLAGNDITVLSTMGYKHSPLTENKKAPSTEHLKEPEDKIDAYVKTQGRQHDMERQTEMRDRESETLWERIGRDEEGKEEIKTREREGEEMEVQKMKTEGKKENLDTEVKKERNQTSKKLTDAGTMTVEDLIGETQDAALQTDRCLAYVDAEIQANVEVCSKSTYMSPIHKPSACGQLNHELDLGHKVSLYSALSPDSNSDSDGLSNLASPDPTPLGLKPRFLGPPPYKSPNIHKSLKHVCQIDIELCSQSAQSNSLTQVTVSEFNATCHDALVSHGASENNSKTAKMDGEAEENGVPQDIVWDEKGMTWEVYGASLDMESLGFAIQNHLQCKIREHERRIGTLRKSICLSEHSPGNNKTGKKKGNVFRSLCGGSKCCSKQPKESVPN